MSGNLNTPDPHYKYDEPEILAEILDYAKSTYGQHYGSKRKRVQLVELLEASEQGDTTTGREFCRGSAIKYLYRYGKKGGYNRKDLLKAAHYIVMMLHFTKEETTQ